MPAISEFPPRPQPTDDQATFSARSYAVVEHEATTFRDEMNAVIEAFNFNATNSTSSTSMTIGTGSSKSLTVEAGKSYVKGMWITPAYTNDPKEWMSGIVESYNSGTGALVFYPTESSGHSTTRAAWTVSQARPNTGQKFYRSARTSNTILTANDYGKLIDITSGTFTQTFDPCASLQDGWWVRIRNSGTGDITLDPSSTQTIDGRTSFIMFPGEVRDIFCNGSALFSVVVNPFFRRITSTYSNMPIPPGYQRFGIRAWSGGASGQRTNNAATLSRGGAGGGCVETILPASSFSTTETVTIGAGGAAVTTVANGNVGSDTTFGSLLTAYAGNLWSEGGSCIDGLIDTNASNKEVTYAGGYSSATTPADTIFGGSSSSSNATAASGKSLYGGAAGGSVDGSGNVRSPGTSTYGGNGGAASIAGNGTAGSQPGGGGGATQTGTQSGAGGDGEVWFWGIV